jgi:hypothetical protein
MMISCVEMASNHHAGVAVSCDAQTRHQMQIAHLYSLRPQGLNDLQRGGLLYVPFPLPKACSWISGRFTRAFAVSNSVSLLV